MTANKHGATRTTSYSISIDTASRLTDQVKFQPEMDNPWACSIFSPWFPYVSMFPFQKNRHYPIIHECKRSHSSFEHK
jgi:hypothetical protein